MKEQKKGEKKDSKKIFLIIGIIFFVAIVGGTVYWFVLRDGADEGGNEQEETAQEERYVPDYVAEDIVDIRDEITATLSGWASDYRIVAITATTRYMEDDLGKQYFGTEGGKFSSWMFEVYSPSKSAVVMYAYTNEVGDLGDDLELDEYAVLGYKDREYFNDLSTFKSTQEVFDAALANGLEMTEDKHIYMYLGQTGEDDIDAGRAVWRIDERSNTQLDEYDIPVILNRYYIDAKTLEVLE
jgi:hypothetical protein